MPARERILEKPKTGPDVDHIQKALYAPRTGVYDEMTEHRVKGVQQAYGLPVSGIVDARTAGAIEALTRSESGEEEG